MDIKIRNFKIDIKWIVIAAVSVVAMVGIYFLYGVLADKFAPNTQQGENAAIDFTMENESGRQVKLSKYYGKPIVLNFWATWCYYCTEEMEYFNEIAKTNPEVQFVMLNVTDGNNETVEKAKKYIEQKGYEFDVFFDTKLEATSKYNAINLPLTVFIDKNGNISSYSKGMISKNRLIQNVELIK